MTWVSVPFLPQALATRGVTHPGLLCPSPFNAPKLTNNSPPSHLLRSSATPPHQVRMVSLPWNGTPARAPFSPGHDPRTLLHEPGGLLAASQPPLTIPASHLPGPSKPALVTYGIYMLYINISLGTGDRFIWEGRQVRCCRSPFLFRQVHAPVRTLRQVKEVRCRSLALQRNLENGLNKGSNITNSHTMAWCHTMSCQNLSLLPIKVKILWREGLMHWGAQGGSLGVLKCLCVVMSESSPTS